MIRFLVKLANALDKRFPEKRVVTAKDYDGLLAKVSALETELSEARDTANIARNGVDVAASRIGVLETSAVHKEAVRTLIVEVKKLQDEYASLKTSLGFTRSAQTPPELSAMLNGEYLGENDNG
jgi:hypothetical protein